MDEDSDPQDVTEEHNREIGVIAAAHRALDPKGREKRADILAESVLQVLRKGPLPEDRVLEEVRRLWGTSSVTAPLIHDALLDAQSAGLVVTQQTLNGTDWVVTDEGFRDTKDDALWAESVFDRFEGEVRDRVDDDAARLLITDAQIPKIAAKLREALMIGAQGMYALGIAASPGSLRPLRFNYQAATDHVDTLQPKTVQKAAGRLLIAAINPHDTFADELVHLLVAGNVLHGMVTRRDVGKKPDLSGVRLAVDTSVIVDLPAGDERVAGAVRQAFKLSQDLGAEVIVAHHSISEWMRLFDAADEEMKFAGGSIQVGVWGDLLNNPFTRAFSVLCEEDPSLTWPKFRAMWHDPTKRLEALGVKVRAHGNLKDVDQETFKKVRMVLGKANRGRTERRLRTASALDADAHSATMVARWRRDIGPQSAYFVAQDRMTGRAYAEACPDDKVPLAITLTAWVTLAAALTTEDPESQATCAGVVTNVALRESFLSIAASYTYKEIRELGETLSADSEPVSPTDVSEFVQQAFEDIEEEIAGVDRPNAIRLRGSRLLQSRAARRSQRARRAEEMTGEQIERARAEERAQGVAEVYEVTKTADQDRAAFRRMLAERDAAAAAEMAKADERLCRQRRVTASILIATVAVAMAIIAGAGGLLSTVDRWRGLVIGLLLVGAFSVAYPANPRVKWWYPPWSAVRRAPHKRVVEAPVTARSARQRASSASLSRWRSSSTGQTSSASHWPALLPDQLYSPSSESILSCWATYWMAAPGCRRGLRGTGLPARVFRSTANPRRVGPACCDQLEVRFEQRPEPSW